MSADRNAPPIMSLHALPHLLNSGHTQQCTMSTNPNAPPIKQWSYTTGYNVHRPQCPTY